MPSLGLSQAAKRRSAIKWHRKATAATYILQGHTAEQC
jgi:hypothetical protein